MITENESGCLDQLKVRIKEYNQKDKQAVARGKQEREKWYQSTKDSPEKSISDQ